MTNPDLVIRNARIVDGTGATGFYGDVAVVGDRISQVGSIHGTGKTEIDAKGLVVSPGFFDIHTHYDAQLCWDRLATPSLEHGITTVLIGNCSFSVAPANPETRKYMNRLFQKVEDLSEDLLDEAVPSTWTSFGEYKKFLEPGLGVNVGALIGLSALRYFVMGEASIQRAANEQELDSMCALLTEAMHEGALGFSMSYGDTDHEDRPVASRLASLPEKIALAKAMMATGRGSIQADPTFENMEQKCLDIAELGEISIASGAMCSALPVMHTTMHPDAWKNEIVVIESMQKRGAKLFGQTMARSFDWNFQLSGTAFFLFLRSTWATVMMTPMPERIAAAANMVVRDKLLAELDTLEELLRYAKVATFKDASNSKYVGKYLPEVAASKNQRISESFLSIVLADNLETEFHIRGAIHADPEIVGPMLNHPFLQIGGSDAGAHISQFAGAGDSTYLFEHWVRKENKLSLEKAVKRLTSECAEQWGVADRGVIKVGKFADLVIFDPDTVVRGEEILVHDVPGNRPRYVRHPRGVNKVIVNGEIVVSEGAYSSARPGRFV